MSEWLSFVEVLEELKIKDFEIFQFLPKGLQPFTDHGQTPMKCPDYCHRYFKLFYRYAEISATLRELKPVIEQIKILNPTGDKSVTLPSMNELIIDLLDDAKMKVKKRKKRLTLSSTQITYIYDLIERFSAEKQAFLNNLVEITQDDQDAISFKYFVIPEIPEFRQKLLDELRTMYFKKAEVEELKHFTVERPLEPFNKEENTDQPLIGKNRIKLLSGFRHLQWFDLETGKWEDFYFSGGQANIVKELYNSDNFELHIKTLLHYKLRLELEEYRLDKQFRNHPNWRKLIIKIKTRRGYWRLNI